MALIINGANQSSLCQSPVVDWEEHGFDFNRAPKTKDRAKTPDLIMLHWTGGENGINGFAGTLQAKSIATEFFVDRYGMIYQLVDPVLRDPYDVGGALGRRTVSIEIANYGFVLRNRPPKKGKSRLTDRERIHGMRFNVARFHPAQIKSVRHLCEALCIALEIPRRLPRDRDGDISKRRWRKKEWKHFSGICGHLHKTDQKYDPGYLIFHLLNRKWYEGTAVPLKYDLEGKFDFDLI